MIGKSYLLHFIKTQHPAQKPNSQNKIRHDVSFVNLVLFPKMYFTIFFFKVKQPQNLFQQFFFRAS